MSEPVYIDDALAEGAEEIERARTEMKAQVDSVVDAVIDEARRNTELSPAHLRVFIEMQEEQRTKGHASIDAALEKARATQESQIHHFNGRRPH